MYTHNLGTKNISRTTDRGGKPQLLPSAISLAATVGLKESQIEGTENNKEVSVTFSCHLKLSIGSKETKLLFRSAVFRIVLFRSTNV